MVGGGCGRRGSGRRVGLVGVAAGVRAAEAYHRGGLPGWAITKVRGGIVSVGGGGGAATGICGGLCESCRHGRWSELGLPSVRSYGGGGGCSLSGALGASVCSLSGVLGASGSGRNGMGGPQCGRGGGGGIAGGNDEGGEALRVLVPSVTARLDSALSCRSSLSGNSAWGL